MGRIRQLEHHNRSCDPFHPKIQPSPRWPHLQVACSPDLWTTVGCTLRCTVGWCCGVVLLGRSRQAGMVQVSDHGDSAAGIFFTAVAPPPPAPPALAAPPAPPTETDLPREGSFTPIPRLTCSDIAYRSYVSAECNDDQITEEPNMRTRNIFESSLVFLLYMSF